MGKYLEQCANDAWEVISGRKKIVGNKIVDCKIDDKRTKTEDYGWLAPNGFFYPSDFGEHQAWASQYLLNERRKGDIEMEPGTDPGDKLSQMGFILIHNPNGYNFSITRNHEKRITNKQREFLIDYFEKRNMDNWLNKIYQEEI